MASIMKRGDSYSVRYKYKDHSGKPCEGWESFKTRKEAQERKITVEKELLDGTFLVPDTMTVEEMLYKWIPIQSTKHKWSPKTYTQSVAMPTEFNILWLLCKNAGKVVSTEEIFEKIWNEKYLDSNNTVMVHIRRIREKLNEPSRNPKFIKTVWGVGYKIEKK